MEGLIKRGKIIEIAVAFPNQEKVTTGDYPLSIPGEFYV